LNVQGWTATFGRGISIVLKFVIGIEYQILRAIWVLPNLSIEFSSEKLRSEIFGAAIIIDWFLGQTSVPKGSSESDNLLWKAWMAVRLRKRNISPA
jgi:hypothetical protein